MSNDYNYDTEESVKQVKTKEQTDRKCPQCEGTMDYNPQTGGLKCPYCDYEEEIIEHQDSYSTAEELDFYSAEETGNCNWGVEKKTVICKSCGAESIYDALQISDECPYCGSNQVMEEKGQNTLAPGGVVPFKVTVKEAAEKFKGWIKRQWFCPTKAKESAKPDSFKGVYLPYWTFDTSTYSEYSAQYGKRRRVYEGDGKYRTVTDWYSTSGTYSKSIDDQLVIGTTKHDENMLRNIEPFNTAANKAYKPEYVAGFISERYSIGLKQAWEKAKSMISIFLRGEIKQQILARHNADDVRSLSVSTRYSDITFKYLLLPIWISSFRYKDKVYQFVVNGQSGKVSGKIPISPLRVAIAVILAIIVAFIFFYIYNN